MQSFKAWLQEVQISSLIDWKSSDFKYIPKVLNIVTEDKTCSSKLNPLQMLATALQLVAEQINETLLLVRQKMMGMLLNVVHCQVQKIVWVIINNY